MDIAVLRNWSNFVLLRLRLQLAPAKSVSATDLPQNKDTDIDQGTVSVSS
jgi:hypothetical protein